MTERGHRKRLDNTRVVVYLNREINHLVDTKFYSPILDKPMTGAKGNIISALLRLWLQADGNTAALYQAWHQFRIAKAIEPEATLEDNL